MQSWIERTTGFAANILVEHHDFRHRQLLTYASLITVLTLVNLLTITHLQDWLVCVRQ